MRAGIAKVVRCTKNGRFGRAHQVGIRIGKTGVAAPCSPTKLTVCVEAARTERARAEIDDAALIVDAPRHGFWSDAARCAAERYASLTVFTPPCAVQRHEVRGAIDSAAIHWEDVTVAGPCAVAGARGIERGTRGIDWRRRIHSLGVNAIEGSSILDSPAVADKPRSVSSACGPDSEHAPRRDFDEPLEGND